MTDKLNILSIGAGAIGTYIGGSLALQGHKVIFVERPEVAAELRGRGLRLNLQGQEHHFPNPEMVGSIEEAVSAQKFDVALFALKSFDTQSFLDALPEDRSQIPTILCLSNGVDNEPTLARAIGPQKVITGTVTSAIGRRGAGDIILERLRGVGVALGNPLSEQLASVMRNAGLNAQLFANAADMKWSKMLTNLIGNATSAILDMPPGEVFDHPGLYRLEIGQLRETLRVMRAQNIHVVDLPGTPVQLLAFAVRFLPLAVSRPLLGKAVGGGRGAKMPSFHIDLYAGRGKSEVDYLNGAVVRAGEKTEIPTPVNRQLRDVLIGLTVGEIPFEEYAGKPGKLISKLIVGS